MVCFEPFPSTCRVFLKEHCNFMHLQKMFYPILCNIIVVLQSEMSFGCHRLDQNSNKNIVRISTLKFFVAFWGLAGDLVSIVIYKEAYS